MDYLLTIPQKVKAVGNPDVEPNTKIYISKNVHRKVYSFARTESNNQIGGIMMGNVVAKGDVHHIILRDFVVAKYTSSNKDTLTFTKDTWAYLDEEKKKYPGMQMVGWMHTNPDRGIEISDYDEFLQTHIFKNAYAVLYIVDPIQVIETYYYLEKNEIKKAAGFYLYVEEGKKSEEEVQPMDKKETIDLNLADGKVHKVYADLTEDIPEVIEEVKEIAFEEVEDGEIQENEMFVYDKHDLSSSVKKNLKKSAEIIQGTENIVLEEVDDSMEDNSNIDKTQTVEEDDFEARLARRRAEKYSIIPEVQEEINKNGSRSGTVNKVLAAVMVLMTVVIVGLSYWSLSLSGKINTMERQLKALYQNDEAIANFINTGSIGGETEAAQTTEAQSEAQADDKGEASSDSDE